MLGDKAPIECRSWYRESLEGKRKFVGWDIGLRDLKSCKIIMLLPTIFRAHEAFKNRDDLLAGLEAYPDDSRHASDVLRPRS